MDTFSRRGLLQGAVVAGSAAAASGGPLGRVRADRHPGWVFGRMTGAQALTEALILEGVGCVYGIPGAQGNELLWAPPYALTPRSSRYVSEIVKLPASGPKRLEYFQNYLEDPEELLGKDAFDEFALAPYSVLLEMKGSLQHDKLLERVQDASITANHRRQYLTMLGVCGRPSDLPILEKLLRSDDWSSRMRSLTPLRSCARLTLRRSPELCCQLTAALLLFRRADRNGR